MLEERGKKTSTEEREKEPKDKGEGRKVEEDYDGER
jgi:hypothetical protein